MPCPMAHCRVEVGSRQLCRTCDAFLAGCAGEGIPVDWMGLPEAGEAYRAGLRELDALEREVAL